MAREQISSILCGFKMPSPVPMGEPSGMTAATPTSSRRLAITGSSEVYAMTVNPSATSVSQAVTVSHTSGSRVSSSLITSTLTQFVPRASRASRAVITVSRAVRHPAVLGRGAIFSLVRSGKIGVPEACLRMATVVISVPDATSAFSSRSMLVVPPEPIMSRDENSFSAIIMATTRPELRSAHRP